VCLLLTPAAACQRATAFAVGANAATPGTFVKLRCKRNP
jgi:hypothetical protein